MVALEQYVRLWCRLQEVTLIADTLDRFIWMWSANHQYSSRSIYRAFFHGQCGVPSAGVLRKTKAPPSSKFFVWLALLDRCWTGESLLHHHMKDDGSCPLCSQVEESIDHLLLGCCYTGEVWYRLLARQGLHPCCLTPHDRIADWWLASRKRIARSSRKGFDSLVVLAWWSV
jgi:hypothetical protein